MFSLKCLYDSAAEGMGQARERKLGDTDGEIGGDSLGGNVDRGGVPGTGRALRRGRGGPSEGD